MTRSCWMAAGSHWQNILTVSEAFDKNGQKNLAGKTRKRQAMNAEQRKKYKAVKQKLSSVQLVIKKDLKDGKMPRQKDINQFVAMSEEMDSLNSPEWQESGAEYMKIIEEFKKAAMSENPQLLMDIFQKLMDSKAACHSLFR